MKGYVLSRRKFLLLLASLPAAAIVGCESKPQKSALKEGRLSPEESLKKLIFILGPWGASERVKAGEFAGRFLKSEHAAKYLPGSGGLVQSLAARFPEGAINVNGINLKDLPEGERGLLTGLTGVLYSLIEVRFFVSGEPRWGDCLGDTTRHTRTPV
jgi:hypothetical protein